MDRFTDKVIMITGGAGDMAGVTAKRLLSEGAKLVLTDYNDECMIPFLEELKELGYGDRVVAKGADVRDMDACRKVADFGRAAFGRIDGLVATAGIIRHHPIDEMPEQDWKDVIDINLTGMFHSVKAVVPGMKEQGYGRIVLVSSLGGRTGRPGVGVNYAASKAGVVGMTMLLGYELGPWNITVNSVAPGPLKGKMFSSMTKENIERLQSGTRIPRLGEVDEIAAAIAFLASDESGWTTGEVLDINGGLQY